MISIVVLTYNHLESATRPCIQSILANTSFGKYELIVVDNASQDGTRAYLENLAQNHNHIRLQLNAINKGYAGGNNDGIKMATGEIIVLLNNDTLVPSGWLESLTAPFQENKQTGLVGPITNSAGNEQTVTLPSLTEKNYEEISNLYTNRHKGLRFQTNRLGFFCVAFKKNIIDKIGLLDENFGIGMFEDDDLCIRAIKAKLNLIVTEDCFVYHKGSVSFSKLSSDSYQELFQRNKKYFEEKHGVKWTFAKISINYANKINDDLILLQNDLISAPPSLERILTRWQTFHHMLRDLNSIESQLSESHEDSESVVKQPSIWQRRLILLKEDLITGDTQSRKKIIIKAFRKLGFKFLK